MLYKLLCPRCAVSVVTAAIAGFLYYKLVLEKSREPEEEENEKEEEEQKQEES